MSAQQRALDEQAERDYGRLIQCLRAMRDGTTAELMAEPWAASLLRSITLTDEYRASQEQS